MILWTIIAVIIFALLMYAVNKFGGIAAVFFILAIICLILEALSKNI
jgi:hypothetical protein